MNENAKLTLKNRQAKIKQTLIRKTSDLYFDIGW